MMNKSNEEVLAKLRGKVSLEVSPWKQEAEYRRTNKGWIRKSQKIATTILRELRKVGKSQKDLAALLDVSPQQVNKWVKGKENFTLETISRIENVLGIELINVNDDNIDSWSAFEKFIVQCTIESEPQNDITFIHDDSYIEQIISETETKVIDLYPKTRWSKELELEEM